MRKRAAAFENGLALIGDGNKGETRWLKEIAHAGLIDIYGKTGETIKAQALSEARGIKNASVEEIERDMKIAMYEKMLADRPDDPKTLGFLTALYYSKKEYDKAERSVGKALEILPDDIWFNRWQGDVLRALDKPGAVEAYERAISLNEDKESSKFEIVSAYTGLAHYYFNKGNREKALENAQKAHALDINNKNIFEFIILLK